MVAKIKTVALSGIDVIDIQVQVQLSPGLPSFSVVGLADKAVAESRERVRSALYAMGLALPARNITINLAPADIVKEGSHYDLPIALGLLVTMGVVAQDELHDTYAMGELSLDASLQPVSGVLPAAMHASAKGSGLICPAANGQEAAWSGLEDLLAPSSLLALVNHFKGTQVLSRPESRQTDDESPLICDMAEIRGQETARRALEVAAAGAHNLLMSGPPGAGKSMLASCLPGILPPLDAKEVLETSIIASVAGKFTRGSTSLNRTRPYRAPHHSASQAAMVGGGRKGVPGEASLAHHGVLFLDELPEFPRAVLESLRQPLETGEISIARVQAHVTYPSRFQLIAAMNPCRCGFVADANRACNKAPRCAVDYQAKISGPLLDRMDMTIEMPEVATLDMLSAERGENSAEVAQRVAEARAVQKARYEARGLPIRTNSEISGEQLADIAQLTNEARALLEQATGRLALSMRGYTRVLRVARTVADLAHASDVGKAHIAEALSYRQLHKVPMQAKA